MRSPIHSFAEGPSGKSQHSHEPIRRAYEPMELYSSPVVLMKDGKWTEQATEEDKKRLEPKIRAESLKPMRERRYSPFTAVETHAMRKKRQSGK